MSSFNVNVGGTWKAAKSVNVNVEGSWKAAKSVWANVAGTWKQVFASIGITLNSTSVSGAVTGPGTPSTTCTATGTPAGGTYAWAYVSGVSFTLTNATTATCTFSHAESNGHNDSGIYKCTYTAGGVSASENVSVFLESISNS